jgi:hypothetical protein
MFTSSDSTRVREYANMGHEVNEDELDFVSGIMTAAFVARH